MVQRCLISGCPSVTGSLKINGEKITFHRIPRVIIGQGPKTRNLSEIRHNQWLKRLRLNGKSKLGDELRVCSNHFFSGIPAQLYDNTNPDWVPSPFLNVKNVSEEDKIKLLSSVSRYKRKVNRSNVKNVKGMPVLTSKENSQNTHSFTEEAHDSIMETVTSDVGFETEEHFDQPVDGSSLEDSGVSLNFSNRSCGCGTKDFQDIGIQTTNKNYHSVCIQTEYVISFDFSMQTEDKVLVDESSQTFSRVCDQVNLEAALFDVEEARTIIENLKCKIEENESLLSSYREEMQIKMERLEDIKKELDIRNFTEYSFVGDNEKVKHFTGLETFEYLLEIFDEVKPYLFKNAKLTEFQQYILTLMKLRLGLTNRDLAYRFCVSERTAGRVFYNTLDAMSKRLARYILWPDRSILQATMPMSFREHFSTKVAVIIDCFEVFAEKPSSVIGQAETWSNYKHHNTVKFLIGITPQGTVSFISKGWGGRVSDKHLTESCGFLEKLTPGDVILADRGFNIAESVGLYYASVKLPTFAKDKKQLDPKDVESTRKIANVRIHVERVIGHIRQKFSILHSKIPIELLHGAPEEDLASIDKIVLVACALVNLCPSVIPLE